MLVFRRGIGPEKNCNLPLASSSHTRRTLSPWLSRESIATCVQWKRSFMHSNKCSGVAQNNKAKKEDRNELHLCVTCLKRSCSIEYGANRLQDWVDIVAAIIQTFDILDGMKRLYLSTLQIRQKTFHSRQHLCRNSDEISILKVGEKIDFTMLHVRTANSIKIKLMRSVGSRHLDTMVCKVWKLIRKILHVIRHLKYFIYLLKKKSLVIPSRHYSHKSM